MSEERFDRIDRELEDIKTQLHGVSARLDGGEDRLDGVEQRLDGVAQRLDGVEQRLGRVEDRLDTLNREMHVLHEDTIHRIEISSERNVVTRDEFYAAFADLKEAIWQRIDPIEAAVRQHSVDINELKRRH